MLKKKSHKIIVGILFLIYLAVLVYILLLKGNYRSAPYEFTLSHQGIYQKPSNYNLVFLETIKLYLKSFLANRNLNALFNLMGNVFIFIPLGIFIPLLWVDKKSFMITFLTGTFLILLIELIQLITVWGILDVDDYFLNIMGVIIGWLCSRIIIKKL